MRCCFLFAFFVFVLLQNCYPQNSSFKIIGKVVDSASAVGLEYVTVSIKDVNSKLAEETKTNKDGVFNLCLAAGIYHLEITHIGYKKIEKQIHVDTNLHIAVLFLQPEISNMRLVTTEAKQPFITVTAGKINLNISESNVFAGSNVWDILQMSPRVIANENGGLSLNGKKTAIYIDGRLSYFNEEQLKNFLTNLHSNSIDKIELIINPTSRYDATGQAVINIKTKKNNKKGFNCNYSAGLGVSKYPRYNLGIDLNYFSNKLNIYGAYDLTHNKNNYLPFSDRTTRFNDQTFYVTVTEDELRNRMNQALRLGFDYDITKRTTIGVLANGFYNQRHREVNGFTNLGSIQSIVDSIINTKTIGDAIFKSPSLNIFLKTNFDSLKNELTLNVDYYKYEQEWDDDFMTTFYDNRGLIYRPQELKRDNSPLVINIYALSIDYCKAFKKNKLLIGIKDTHINTDNDIIWENNFGNVWINDTLKSNYFIYKEKIFAFYSTYDVSTKKWNASIGFRTENTSNVGSSVTMSYSSNHHYVNLFPNLNVTYKPGNKNQLTFNYRKSIGRPYYKYVNPFLIYQGQYNYFRGNPDMRASYSHSFQLIHSWNSVVFTTLSYTFTKGLISVFYKQNDATKIITQYYDNLETTNYTSLNITFSKSITSWWTNSSFGTISLFSSQHDSLISRKSSIQSYIGQFNSFSLKHYGLKFELSGYYVGGYRDGLYTYKPYGSLNFGIQINVLNKKAILKFSARDLFNTSYLKYKAGYNNIDIYTTSNYDSRVILLNFTYHFGKKFTSSNKNRKSNIESETNRIN